MKDVPGFTNGGSDISDVSSTIVSRVLARVFVVWIPPLFARPFRLSTVFGFPGCRNGPGYCNGEIKLPSSSELTYTSDNGQDTSRQR